MGIERDPELMEEFLDKLEGTDPAVADVLVNNPEDIDAILLQFPIYSDNPEATKALQEDIEALWFGEDDAITAISETIISITVTDEITDRQTEAISTTVAVALGILIIFFWVMLRQPALGVFAVGPIVLVLICVLGTMALLGIPYTLVTFIITALSIGIGVDYTIHMIHRYREEFLPPAQPGEGGDPDPRDHWFGVVGLCIDDRTRARSARGLATGCIQAIRHHGGNHHLVLADILYPAGTARDDGLAGVPEHAAALNGGAPVERARHSYRRRASAPRTGKAVDIEIDVALLMMALPPHRMRWERRTVKWAVKCAARASAPRCGT